MVPEPKPIRSFYDVPGWFRWVDKTMFDTLLRVQSSGPPGDIVELGAYLGKSAVVLGSHLREGDRFVVVDLFGTDPGEYESSTAHDANRSENRRSYASLERAAFEANYLALHDELPVVVTGLSNSIVDHVAPGSARFVHVDAGHLYENVREDVENTRQLLGPGGIAVFDDYRSEHTPGVSAAVWGAVATGGLQPFALSSSKFYGCYDDPTPYFDALRRLVDSDPRYRYDVQQIMGHQVIRLNQERKPSTPPPPGATLAELRVVADDIVKRVVKQTKPPAPKPAPPRKPVGRRPGATGMVKDLLPPVVTRAIVRRRRSRR